MLSCTLSTSGHALYNSTGCTQGQQSRRHDHHWKMQRFGVTERENVIHPTDEADRERLSSKSIFKSIRDAFSHGATAAMILLLMAEEQKGRGSRTLELQHYEIAWKWITKTKRSTEKPLGILRLSILKFERYVSCHLDAPNQRIESFHISLRMILPPANHICST